MYLSSIIKFTVIIFFFCSNIPILFAQQSFTLADSAVWLSKTSGWDDPGGWYVSDSGAELKYDSVLFEGNYWRIYNGEASNALVRCVSGKVYAVNVNASSINFDSTYTLYDFTLSIGDTAFSIFHSTHSWDPNYYLILQTIYDTVISGKTLKVFQFNHDKWIENIGSVSSFLNPIVEHVPIGASFNLCQYKGWYSDSSLMPFELELYYPHFCILSLQEKEINRYTISVLNENLIINGVTSPTEFQIYSLTGAFVDKGIINSSGDFLSILHLNRGIYFLNLEGNTFKFIRW